MNSNMNLYVRLRGFRIHLKTHLWIWIQYYIYIYICILWIHRLYIMNSLTVKNSSTFAKLDKRRSCLPLGYSEALPGNGSWESYWSCKGHCMNLHWIEGMPTIYSVRASNIALRVEHKPKLFITVDDPSCIGISFV